MGVDVFFVLSGMLMSILLFEKRISLRDFYIRRFSRIYPAFFVYLVFACVVGVIFSIEFSWSELFSSLFFLRTYLPVEPGIWSSGLTIAHLWSLNIEEHAYLFLSVVTLLLVNRRIVGITLLLLALGSILLSFYYYARLTAEDFKLYSIRTESAVVFILFSAGYGLLARKYQWTLPSWIPVVCLFIALMCYVDAAPDWFVFAVSPVVLGIAVNHLDQMPSLLKSIFSNVFIRHLGLWSYSIYLWQQFFFEYSWRIPGGKVTALLLAFAVGVLSYYFLERPVRYWVNRKWSANPVYRATPQA